MLVSTLAARYLGGYFLRERPTKGKKCQTPVPAEISRYSEQETGNRTRSSAAQDLEIVERSALWGQFSVQGCGQFVFCQLMKARDSTLPLLAV